MVARMRNELVQKPQILKSSQYKLIWWNDALNFKRWLNNLKKLKNCHITHHEGVGQAEAHQPGGQVVVQRVGDGGHSCYQHHTGPNILLQRHTHTPKNTAVIY